MQKAVEDSVDKIRRNLEDEWTSLTSEDLLVLKGILGDVWVSIERTSWDNMVFSRLTKGDIEEIIRIGKEADTKKNVKTGAISEVQEILSHPGSF